ncbi:hypothetical protein EX895_001498 [Sporisorium graminicola]|uniref:Uncharacterized protein n=1 Tax=Sporisorium graminicola TaxID=280036 RepID=A0A4U7KYB0_9BASI|nr:hypothetical protein EX895_001498 [Sporisorium graminicola]TKY89713.1 hypothetical protein EX895_001498 [Sporisorium graminicola]
MHNTAAAAQTPATATATLDLVGVLVVLLRPSTPADRRRFEDLQTLRRKHDQAFERWLPHITLVPPFTLSSSSLEASSALASGTGLEQLVQLHTEKLSQIAKAAAEVCHTHASHRLLLDQVSTFPLRNYTNVHLRPAPPTNSHDKRKTSSFSSATSDDQDHSSHRIVKLQSDLSQALTPVLHPNKASSARRRETFRPHVSVGQSTSGKATWQLCRSAERVLGYEGSPGLLCDVDRVQLMIKPKGSAGAYHVHQELPLSRSSSP